MVSCISSRPLANSICITCCSRQPGRLLAGRNILAICFPRVRCSIDTWRCEVTQLVVWWWWWWWTRCALLQRLEWALQRCERERQLLGHTKVCLVYGRSRSRSSCCWRHSFEFTLGFLGGERMLKRAHAQLDSGIRRAAHESVAEHRSTVKEKKGRIKALPPSSETVKPIHETNVNNFWHNFDPSSPPPPPPAPPYPRLPRKLRDALLRRRTLASPAPEWKEASYSPPNIERHGAGALHGGVLAWGEKTQARGDHSVLLSATGCSSVPGWRQLSLGRFAKADWCKATSALLWFCFRRARRRRLACAQFINNC